MLCLWEADGIPISPAHDRVVHMVGEHMKEKRLYLQSSSKTLQNVQSFAKVADPSLWRPLIYM